MLLPSLVEGHGGGLFIIMTVIDIVILVFIGIGTVWGMMKGFIRQLSSLVGLIVGLLVARALFVEVGDWVAPAIGVSATIGRVLAFFMLWIIVPLLFSLFASFLTKALQVVHLGWVNRWLGGGLGAIKFMLFVGMAAQLLEFVDTENDLLPQTIKNESVLYKPMYDLAGAFIPAIKVAGEQIVGQSQNL